MESMMELSMLFTKALRLDPVFAKSFNPGIALLLVSMSKTSFSVVLFIDTQSFKWQLSYL